MKVIYTLLILLIPFVGFGNDLTGCTDSTALNYNSSAISDDGCCHEITNQKSSRSKFNR